MRFQDEMILQLVKTVELTGRKDAVKNELLCLLYLCMRATPSSKEITVRVSDMKDSLGIGGRTVRKALQRLLDAGHITKSTYQYGPYRRYLLNL